MASVGRQLPAGRQATFMEGRGTATGTLEVEMKAVRFSARAGGVGNTEVAYWSAQDALSSC